MSKINAVQRLFLEEKFGSRVTFNKTERKLYGHDIAVTPGLFRPLIGDTLPEAVVQPESEGEDLDLVRRVAERIPMPDYMREQMPSLMPKVMENLMPHDRRVGPPDDSADD